MVKWLAEHFCREEKSKGKTDARKTRSRDRNFVMAPPRVDREDHWIGLNTTGDVLVAIIQWARQMEPQPRVLSLPGCLSILS